MKTFAHFMEVWFLLSVLTAILWAIVMTYGQIWYTWWVAFKARRRRARAKRFVKRAVRKFVQRENETRIEAIFAQLDEGDLSLPFALDAAEYQTEERRAS